MRHHLLSNFLYLWIGLCISIPSPAQRHDIHFARFGPEDGLSSGWVLSIHQDRTGYLWIGTYEGLNRYDGYTFRSFKSNIRDTTSLLKDYVTGLLEDTSGSLWVATTGGLHLYDRHQQNFRRFMRHKPGSEDASVNKIVSMVADRRNKLWLATESAGLVSFDLDSKTFRSFQHDPSDPTSLSSDYVRTLFVDADDHIWVSTNGGVDIVDPSTGSIDHWSDRQSVRMRRTLHSVVGMAEDREGHHWFTVSYGALLYWHHQKGWKKFVPSWVSASAAKVLSMTKIVKDSIGRMWIGSYFDGLLQFDPRTEKFTRHVHDPSERATLSAMTVTALFLDRSQNLWVGTEFGLNRCDTKSPKFVHHVVEDVGSPTKRLNNIRSLAEDRRGFIWMGVEGKSGDAGLVRYDLQRNRSEAVPVLEGNKKVQVVNIYDMKKDSAGNLWLATYDKGLCRLDPETRQLTRYHPLGIDTESAPRNHVRSVFVGRSGSVWFAPRGRAVQLLDPRRSSIRDFSGLRGEPVKNGALNILTLYEDRRRTLWIGTLGLGLLSLGWPRETYTSYKFASMDSAALSYDVVSAIAEDRKGRLWVGTTEGLNRFDASSRTFTQYTEQTGFPAAVVCAIVVDQSGRLWMSTDRGIVRYDERLPAGAQFRSYDPDDGLQGYEFNRGAFTVTEAGEVYFAGHNGMNSFFPDSVKENPFTPKVVLTAMRTMNRDRIFDRSVDEVDTIVVSHAENMLTFEFAALEFTNPRRNRFAYMLQGFDPEWVYARNVRAATYTNLDPGTYTLRVKASNNDDLWNESGLSLTLVVNPPYWATWWFRSVVIAFVIGGIVLLGRRREMHLRKLRLAQEDFSRRLIEEQEAERKRIAAELHDGLGQNILIMKNKAVLAKQNRKRSKLLTKELDDISAMASASLDEARRISYNLRPYQLDRFGLTEALREMIEEVMKSSKIRLACEVEPIDGLFPPGAEINIYRVVQEALNNVVRHSGAHEGSVRVSRAGTSVFVTIVDNGRGFDPKRTSAKPHRRGGFGLTGIRERVRLLGGSVAFASAQDQGTTITIDIPVKHA